MSVEVSQNAKEQVLQDLNSRLQKFSPSDPAYETMATTIEAAKVLTEKLDEGIEPEIIYEGISTLFIAANTLFLFKPLLRKNYDNDLTQRLATVVALFQGISPDVSEIRSLQKKFIDEYIFYSATKTYFGEGTKVAHFYRHIIIPGQDTQLEARKQKVRDSLPKKRGRRSAHTLMHQGVLVETLAYHFGDEKLLATLEKDKVRVNVNGGHIGLPLIDADIILSRLEEGEREIDFGVRDDDNYYFVSIMMGPGVKLSIVLQITLNGCIGLYTAYPDALNQGIKALGNNSETYLTNPTSDESISKKAS